MLMLARCGWRRGRLHEPPILGANPRCPATCLSATSAATLHGLVVSVADGDTITILDDQRQRHKIRLQGIDAPETRQSFGKLSKHNLSTLGCGP